VYYVKEKKGGLIELGNSGLIAGAFSSTSGKADTVLDTNGQILYYNNGRKALDKEDNDDVLTLKSGLPSWEAAASGGANTALSNLSSVAVNATIDMNDQIIKDMKAGIGWGKLEEISAYQEASATASSHTFTLTEEDLDLYDALVLTYSFVTSAAFNLELVVDGITSGYAYSTSEDDGGTFANSTGVAQSQFVIMDSSILDTDTIYAMGQVLFLPAEQSEGGGLCDIVFQGGVSTKGNAWGNGHVACTLASFGSIKIQTSTSTWVVNARFNLMGRRK